MRNVVLLLALVGPGIALAQPRVSFESEKGKKPLVASTVALEGGVLATVAVVGAIPDKAHLGVETSGPALKLAIHDPVSRLTLLEIPDGIASTGVVKRGTTRNLQSGSAIYLDPAKKDEPSRVVSWENRYRESVLPLSLMRVHHPGDLVPEAGTALYNADGELVAICHQAAPDFGRGTYALPVEVIARVEKDRKARGRVVRCWIGIVMEVKHTVPSIMTVRPESPAAKAGIKKGDILLQVGALEVRSYADAVNAFYYLVSGEQTVVKVLRGTEPLEMAVVPEVNPILKREGDD